MSIVSHLLLFDILLMLLVVLNRDSPTYRPFTFSVTFTRGSHLLYCTTKQRKLLPHTEAFSGDMVTGLLILSLRC